MFVKRHSLIVLLVTEIVFFCLFAYALTSTGMSERMPKVMAAIMLTFVTFFFMTASIKIKLTSNEKILFWITYLINVSYTVYKLHGQNLLSPMLTSDALGFWDVANQYYNGNYYLHYTYYPYVLNWEFHIFGRNLACCLLVNVAFFMAMILVAFSAFNRMEIRGNKRLLADFIVCLLPYTVTISSSLLREPLYFLMIAVSFNEFYKYLYSSRKENLYMAILSMLPVLIMHIGYFPIPVIYFLISLQYDKVKNGRELFGRIVSIVLMFVFVVLTISLRSTSYILKSASSVDALFQTLAGGSHYEDTLNAGSAYLLNLQAYSWGQVILYAPIRIIYYMFSPLPPYWRRIIDFVTFFADSIIHAGIIVFCMKYIRKTKIKKRRKKLNKSQLANYTLVKTGLLIIFGCAVVFSAGTSTAGTAIRHRDVLIAVEAIILAAALYDRGQVET